MGRCLPSLLSCEAVAHCIGLTMEEYIGSTPPKGKGA